MSSMKNMYEETLKDLYKAKEYLNNGEIPDDFITVKVHSYGTIICTINNNYQIYPLSYSINDILKEIDKRIVLYESFIEKENRYKGIREEIENHLEYELKWLCEFGKKNGLKKEDTYYIIINYIEQKE